MGISVNGAYQKQGSYTVNDSSRSAGGAKKTDAQVSEAAQTTAVDNDSTQPQVTEAARDSAEKSAEFDEKRDQKEREQIKQAVSKINKQSNGTEAIFGIHDKTNRVTIKIVDKETKKVIKEYPPEKTLDMIAKVWELAGLMVDEKK